jgi:hypothetical protein
MKTNLVFLTLALAIAALCSCGQSDKQVASTPPVQSKAAATPSLNNEASSKASNSLSVPGAATEVTKESGTSNEVTDTNHEDKKPNGTGAGVGNTTEPANPAEGDSNAEGKSEAGSKAAGDKGESSDSTERGKDKASEGTDSVTEPGKAGADANEKSEQAEEKPVDPIEQFKALDPREIIDRKYEDLKEQHTEPWNEEDPEQFIPDTGRVDPLTRVREAVPEELKPPRAGETDQNEINSYLIASDATMMVYGIAYSMQCYNVIQIGIQKQATIAVAGNRFMIGEGDTAGPFVVGYSNGIPLEATITCTSISESEVDLTITVSGSGTSTSISKSQVFIPKSWR